MKAFTLSHGGYMVRAMSLTGLPRGWATDRALARPNHRILLWDPKDADAGPLNTYFPEAKELDSGHRYTVGSECTIIRTDAEFSVSTREGSKPVPLPDGCIIAVIYKFPRHIATREKYLKVLVGNILDASR